MLTTIHGLELPIALTPVRRWTDEELFEFCGDENDDLGMENDSEGELMLMSPSGGGSGRGELLVGGQLLFWTLRSGHGTAFSSSTGYKLRDGSTLSPDASWISLARWDTLTLRQQRGWVPLCPEFVVELLSPTDRAEKARIKMLRWMENGVELGWLIDPFARTVEIYRPGLEPELLEGPETVIADGPVAGFELDLRQLWAEA